MPGTFYDFEWDTKKARTNLRKHGVSFRHATSVLRDPLALTIFDDGHGETEERWVSIGHSRKWANTGSGPHFRLDQLHRNQSADHLRA